MIPLIGNALVAALWATALASDPGNSGVLFGTVFFGFMALAAAVGAGIQLAAEAGR